MAENFIKATGSKTEQYNTLLPQIAAIIEGETDLIANLANIAAMLKEQFNWLWVGFYLVKNDSRSYLQDKYRRLIFRHLIQRKY